MPSRPTAAVVGSALVAALVVAPVTPAAATTKPARDCVLVVDKLHPGESASRVVSYQCYAKGRIPRTALRGTQLMGWWADADFKGAYTSVEGSSGPCDRKGYGFSYVGDDWNDRISSYRVVNRCVHTQIYDHDYYRGDNEYKYGHVSWVGSFMNDRISSMRVWSN